MNAQSKHSPRPLLASGVRLEDRVFGATLAGIAVAALIVVAAPAFDQGRLLADSMESCSSLVTIAWPVANAAIGLPGG